MKKEYLVADTVAQAIGAKAIADKDMKYYPESGVMVVNYTNQYKDFTRDSEINKLMHRIESISINSDFVIHGTNDKGNFKVDLRSLKVRGLFENKEVQFKARGLTNRAIVNLHRNGGLTSISLATLVGCMMLLASGYYLDDWSSVGVNHKDNSAGQKALMNDLHECISFENLELYSLKNRVLNTTHGNVFWDIVKRTGMHPSFSLYNTDFVKYSLDAAIQAGKDDQLYKDILSKWPHKVIDGVTLFEEVC